MRERNKNLIKIIGDLTQEIEQQDLEQINGGMEPNMNTITVTINDPIKNTRALRCSAVLSLTVECGDYNNKCGLY